MRSEGAVRKEWDKWERWLLCETFQILSHRHLLRRCRAGRASAVLRQSRIGEEKLTRLLEDDFGEARDKVFRSGERQIQF